MVQLFGADPILRKQQAQGVRASGEHLGQPGAATTQQRQLDAALRMLLFQLRTQRFGVRGPGRARHLPLCSVGAQPPVLRENAQQAGQ